MVAEEWFIWLNVKKCLKLYFGSTIIAFRTRFNNHKSSMKRYEEIWRRSKGYSRGAFVCPFFEEGHAGLADVEVIIIDKTNVNNPTERKGIWAYLNPWGIEHNRFYESDYGFYVNDMLMLLEREYKRRLLAAHVLYLDKGAGSPKRWFILVTKFLNWVLGSNFMYI